jgi:hypothetical protein
MRRPALNDVLSIIDEIYDIINFDCAIKARTAIAANLEKISRICESEHISNNGGTLRAHETKCKISSEDMMGSEEYIKILNMRTGETLEIECDKNHYQFLRALIKKHNPKFRIRTINLCGIKRRLMRVDHG